MRFYSGESVFSYSWEQVATAFWKRYPNPYSKHVLSEDVLERSVEGNVLYTKRLLTKTNPMPSYAERLVGKLRHVFIIEESLVDPARHTIVTYTRNFGALSGVMSIDERVDYRPGPTDASSTQLRRQAWISSRTRGLSSMITKFGLERFRSNAVKAYKGFLHVLSEQQQPARTLLNSQALRSLRTDAQEKVREHARQIAQKAEGAKELGELAAKAAKGKSAAQV